MTSQSRTWLVVVLVVILLAAGGVLAWVLVQRAQVGTQVATIPPVISPAPSPTPAPTPTPVPLPSPQPTRGTVAVTVCDDPEGNAICESDAGRDATLTLTSFISTSSFSATGTTSGSQPQYIFTGVPDGTYRLTTEPTEPGAVVTTQNPETISVAGTGSTSVGVQLQQAADEYAATISKSASPTTTQPGGTVNYTVSWQVTGPGGFTGPATIVDDYDESAITIVSTISDGGVDNGDTITWQTGALDLSSGSAGGTLTYAATVATSLPTLPATVPNTATINVMDPIISGSTSASITVSGSVQPTAAPELAIVKNVVDVDGGNVERGDTLRYSINVTNAGPGTATGVRITDNVGPYLEQFSVTATPSGSTNNSTSNGGTNGTGRVDVCCFSMPSSSTAVVEYTVVVSATVPDSTTIANVAVASDDQGDSVQDDANVTTDVPAPPVELTQTPTTSTPTPSTSTSGTAATPSGTGTSTSSSPTITASGAASEVVDAPVTGIDPLVALWIALGGALVAGVLGYAVFNGFRVLR